jgi:hypothetical protein
VVINKKGDVYEKLSEEKVKNMTTLSAVLTLYIPHAGSLKDKRMVAKGVIDKTKRKFNTAVAEVGTQDVHQTLTLGIAVVSGEYTHALNMLDEVIRYIEGNIDAELVSVEKV